ncbi:Putative lipoprotein yerB precursor [Bhargavaea cecembensis DSE10]|uniref:Putative lipoprotein yerB n=1 Tax=Bhargavaea cecembensis DSE10 TaxID=1235279 RepID=M7P5H0_9BACL|nr:DUF3048 domain-containing protein [Bhargavaea cecembensis]EMR05754.1 Putative lipoprotein yerB precursor [Bhargavaea cecembensis DSE10]
MKKRTWIAALAVAVLLAGCSESTAEEPAERDVPEKENEEKPDEAFAEVTYTGPYTGLEMETEPDMRPVLATLNNHPQARPQSGLAEADVIYEMLAEYEVTRLLALYQSEMAETLGPIRSARDYFIELAGGHGAIFITHGQSPEAKSLLDSGAVDHLNGIRYEGTLFFRSKDRKAPHNSYISEDAVFSGAQDSGFRMDNPKDPGWRFDPEPPTGGEASAEADVTYGRFPNFNSRYVFDPNNASYTRFAGGEETVDAAGDKPVRLANVLILEVPHRVIDDKGRRSLDLTAGGEAAVLRSGLVYQATWEMRDGIPTVMDGDQPFALAPGKTWIHLVPDIADTLTHHP